MKIEVYGTKWLKEKIEQDIEKKLQEFSKIISKANIYLSDMQKECMDCMYPPNCEEYCAVKNKVYESQ